MKTKRPRRPATDTPTPEIVERVCRLNSFLVDAANWIEERARKTRAAYLAGGGVKDYQRSGDHWEDYELSAIVKCSLGSDDPAFDPDDEYANMIAVVESFMLKHEEPLAWSDCSGGWGEGLPGWHEKISRLDAFQQTRFCHLFHEIYEHALGYDLDSLARIGEIEINLILTRQRGIHLDTAVPPGNRKAKYSRNVFSRPLSSHLRDISRAGLTGRELCYASTLNEKMREARAWIKEQARRCEKEYGDIGGLDGQLTADNAYEDYEMMMRVCGCLGDDHPQYNEDDDNIVVSYDEALYKKNQRVFGRSRNPLHYERYGLYFPATRFSGDIKIYPCGLFWAIFQKADRDWLKMLSIGQLWLDFVFLQRRIIKIV